MKSRKLLYSRAKTSSKNHSKFSLDEYPKTKRKVYFFSFISIICVALSFLFGCQNSNMDYQSETPTAAPVDFSTPTPQPSRYNEYDIVLDIDPDSRTVRGIEKIKFTNNSDIPLLSVYINTYLNAFSEDCDYQPYFDSFKPKIFVRGVSYGGINVINVAVNGSDVKFSHKNTILCFDLDSPLSPNATVEITIGFAAKIPEINHRTGANDFAMWFGNFLPTLAVHSSEGWQIDKYYAAGYPFYSRIANYHVVINTPVGYTVAGTGQKSSVTKENGKSTLLEAKLTRDFAFAISRDYKEEIFVTESGVEITLYYYSDIDNAAALLKSAADSLSYYNAAIGSYPYSSLDIIECELFQKGGMKYPQVIFMDSEHLRERAAAETIARQVGYQWFYNVIGVNGVTEAWIFEGLTALLHDSFYFPCARFKTTAFRR